MQGELVCLVERNPKEFAQDGAFSFGLPITSSVAETKIDVYLPRRQKA